MSFPENGGPQRMPLQKVGCSNRTTSFDGSFFSRHDDRAPPVNLLTYWPFLYNLWEVMIFYEILAHLIFIFV
jgi:hypothetical protein